MQDALCPRDLIVDPGNVLVYIRDNFSETNLVLCKPKKYCIAN